MQLQFIHPTSSEVVGLLVDNECEAWDVAGPNILKVDFHCYRLLIEFEYVLRGHYQDEEDTIWIPSVVRVISVVVKPN